MKPAAGGSPWGANLPQTKPERWFKAREQLRIYFANATLWTGMAKDYYTCKVAADVLMAVETHCMLQAHHTCLRQLAQRGYRGVGGRGHPPGRVPGAPVGVASWQCPGGWRPAPLDQPITSAGFRSP